MSTRPDAQHEETVRRSFARQVHLFSGPDSPFARRGPGTLAWLEPLDADMVVLDVACGAAHATEPVAPHVRQVIGIDLTPALLAAGRGETPRERDHERVAPGGERGSPALRRRVV